MRGRIDPAHQMDRSGKSMNIDQIHNFKNFKLHFKFPIFPKKMNFEIKKRRKWEHFIKI